MIHNVRFKTQLLLHGVKFYSQARPLLGVKQWALRPLCWSCRRGFDPVRMYLLSCSDTDAPRTMSSVPARPGSKSKIKSAEDKGRKCSIIYTRSCLSEADRPNLVTDAMAHLQYTLTNN